jgi:hypothetical protein
MLPVGRLVRGWLGGGGGAVGGEIEEGKEGKEGRGVHWTKEKCWLHTLFDVTPVNYDAR